MIRTLFVLLLAGTLISPGLSAEIEKNSWANVWGQTSAFTDARNTDNKMTNVVSLRKVLNEGSVGGVRLGMDVNALLEEWGRPMKIGKPTGRWTSNRSYDGMQCAYTGIQVLFDVSQNTIAGISFRTAEVRFSDGISSRSTTNDLARILGLPQKVTNIGSFEEAVYQGSNWTMTVVYALKAEPELSIVTLEKKPSPR